MDSSEDRYKDVRSGLINNSQQLGTLQVPPDKKLNKEIVIYTYIYNM